MTKLEEILHRIKTEGFENVRLTEKEFRVLQANLETHKCGKSTIRCCSVDRCESCQIEHMRLEHSDLGRATWRRFQSTTVIVERERRKEVISKPKRKVEKVRGKVEFDWEAAIKSATPAELRAALRKLGM